MVLQINGILLRNCLDILAEFLDQDGGITLRFTAKGMLVRQSDASNAFMVNLYLPKSIFSNYDIPKGLIYFNPRELRKKLVRLDNITTAKLDFKEDRIILDLAGRYGHRRYGTGISDESYAKESPPEVKAMMSVKAKVFGDALYEAARDAHVVSGNFFIEARKDPKRLVIYSVEQGTFNSSWNELLEHMGYMELEVEETSKSQYSCEMMEDMAKAAGKLSNVALVEFAADSIMRVEYQLPFDGGELYFYLCPFVEKD